MMLSFKNPIGVGHMLCAVAVVVSVSGCATVKNIDPTTDKNVGFTHYEAKVYLVRRVGKDGSASLDVVTLPDLSKKRSIRHRPGWGSLDFNFTLANGVLTGFGQKADTAVPAGITALGALGTGYGGYAGGRAALAALGSDDSGDVTADMLAVGTHDGPAGFTTTALTAIADALLARADEIPISAFDDVLSAARQTMLAAHHDLGRLNAITEVTEGSSFEATVDKWKSEVDKSVTKPISRTIGELTGYADKCECVAGNEARDLARNLKNEVIAPIATLFKPSQTIRIWEIKRDGNGIEFEPKDIAL